MKAEKLREKIRNKKVIGWRMSEVESAGSSGHVWLRRISYAFVVFMIAFVALALGATFNLKVREVLHGAAGLVENIGSGANGVGLHGAADLNGESDLQGSGNLQGAAGGLIFKDVPSGSPAARAILYLKDKGYLQGFGDGTFRPSEPMARAALLVLISKIRGAIPHPYVNSYCFKDVEEEWFARYICSAKRSGLVSGTNKYFRPEENITRAEAIKIIVNAFERPAPEVPALDQSKDQSKQQPKEQSKEQTGEQSKLVSQPVDQPWYKQSLEIARSKNWLWPDFSENAIQESLTREEAAIILYNVVYSGGALK